MSAEYIWTLDSLEQDGGSNFTKRFKDLFNNPDSIAFGGDFTVTASLRLSADGYLDSSFSARASDNSLFDTTSTDGTAKIANLRHLQNLDSDFSGAAGKKTAVQCADIDCSKYIGNDGNELVSNYEFKPIQNNDLTAYDACHEEAGAAALPYSISNLTVTANSADGKNGAGLFGSGGAIKFQSICLDKPNVTAGRNAEGNPHSAGALMGYCWGPATFDSCQVIDATVTGSGSVSYSGGMVGHVNNSEFTGCTVRGNTFINGSSNAGGLAGLVDSSGSSFEKCRVVSAQVSTPGVAGGMAGSTWSGTVKFEECSVEGITMKSTTSYAGGLMGWIGAGGGKVKFTTCGVGTNGTNISVSGFQAGGILGNADGNATLSKCTVGKLNGAGTVVIFGNIYAGGLVGDSLFGNTFTLTGCEAFNAKVTADNWDNTGIAGGLVGSVKLGAFTDCHAVNATVTAQVDAGGLAGRTNGTNLTKCWVYWKDTAGMTASDYKITAVTAGGLVGSIKGGGTITESFAAMLVKGTTYAGGLVGNLDMPAENQLNNPTKITKSYADCYIWSGSWAGGLIGVQQYLIDKKGEETEEVYDYLKLTLQNVYATGKISGAGSAAGLCGGWATIRSGKETEKTENVYVAMQYSGVASIYSLAAHWNALTGASNYCFLNP